MRTKLLEWNYYKELSFLCSCLSSFLWIEQWAQWKAAHRREKNVYKIMSSEKMSIKLHILQFSVVEVCQRDYYFRKNTIFSTCHNVMIWIEWHFLWFHTIIMNGCWWSWENVSGLNSKRWLLCSKFICHMHQFLSLIHFQLNHKPLMPIFTI